MSGDPERPLYCEGCASGGLARELRDVDHDELSRLQRREGDHELSMPCN